MERIDLKVELREGTGKKFTKTIRKDGLIPGVVSDKQSIAQESFENDSLDFPHYTRPEDFRGLKVPKVLLSGNHALIEEWRKNKSYEITKKRRPDLLK